MPAEPAVDAVAEPVPDVPVDGAEDGSAPEGEVPKKKTRRGTRGGRKRKKPSTNSAESAATVVDGSSGDNGVPEEAPETYVPMSEWIDDFDSRSRS